MTDAVDVAVPAPLRFLLPGRDRHRGVRRMRFDPDATVAHLVQAAGVPLTEVGGVRVGGEPVPLSARTRPGTVLEVDPVPRPQPVPPGGFLLDVGLGTLARRLRLLGLEAAWSNDAQDADLAARAAAEERVLLTQDRGLLMRRGVRGALVRGSRPDDQLADVLDRFAPSLDPLTRCTACGARLEPVPKADVADRLPPGTRRTFDDFSRCPACGRVYWHGAHARRIGELVGRAARQVGD
ncbi:Mut7-C RNAse domain-containing protein [Geodermatophilus sp. URMC 61]|uniref:Mut7-C RNAse domain-containing protein n=1 Tax=Geodermatophilus sp. URMC 61 TaxID=3423411 RepID=UPI00406C3060